MTTKLEQDRRAKREKMQEMGIDPYGKRFPDAKPVAKVLDDFGEGRLERSRIAGRLVLFRPMGKLAFAQLRDSSGTMQIALSKQALGEQFKLTKLLDLGDLVGVEGKIGPTKTGEITLWADTLEVLGKALLPPPEKWHGLADVELRYRQRYVDLWANPDVMRLFQKRSNILTAVRNRLRQDNFLEVETPMMQTHYGGAAARPFVTHHNTLDMDLFLRISPELYLKRLLVGGMERVFEINRNFRNEGISTQHNPEFTMLEAYQAYADLTDMMTLTESLTAAAIEALDGRKKRHFGERELDFTPPWPRKTYSELLRQYAGVGLDDMTGIRKKAAAMEINESNMADAVVANELFEREVEQHLMGPIFVTDYPAPLCPLTKRRPDNPDLAERFELYIAGMEIANAYTELNDPDLQAETLSRQLQGEKTDETMRVMDEDFITALKVAMPPAGGLGVGIDRLVMLLTDTPSIRDVILFPLLRPSGPGLSGIVLEPAP